MLNADDGLHCPMCGGAPVLSDLEVLLEDLISMPRGLSENAQSILETLWLAGGQPVATDRIFDRMYDHDPEGGPHFGAAYKELRQALAELASALEGTGLKVESIEYQHRYRLLIEAGAYVV